MPALPCLWLVRMPTCKVKCLPRTCRMAGGKLHQGRHLMLLLSGQGSCITRKWPTCMLHNLKSRPSVGIAAVRQLAGVQGCQRMLRCTKSNQATSAIVRTAVTALLTHEALMNLSCTESFPESLC